MKTNLRDWVIQSTSTQELTERVDLMLSVMDKELEQKKDQIDLLKFMVSQYSEVLNRVIEPPHELDLES